MKLNKVFLSLSPFFSLFESDLSRVKQCCLVVILSLVVSCISFTSTAVPLSLDALFQLKHVKSVSISPNGKWIAFTRTSPRKTLIDEDGIDWVELYLVNKEGVVRPFVTGDEYISSVKWSADGRSIFYLAKRFNDKYVSLYQIPADGGESRKVYSHAANIKGYDIAADGNRVIFWAQPSENDTDNKLVKLGFNAHVYEEALQRNQLWTFNLADDNNAVLIPNQQHVYQASIAPNSTLIQVLSAPSSGIDDVYMKSTLSFIAFDGTIISKAKHVGKIGKPVWSPDSEKVAFIGTNDLNDPEEGRLLIAKVGASSVINSLPKLTGHVRQVDWLDNKTTIFIVEKGTQTALAKKRYDKPSSSYEALLNKKWVFKQFSLDKKADNIALINQSATMPSEVYLASQSEKFVKRLTQSNPSLKNTDLAQQVVYKYKTRDGLTQEGILVYPTDYDEHKTYPLIMFIHGGPEFHYSNGWINKYSSPAQVAAGQGFFSFFPNYRGSTGKGVAYTQLGQGDPAGAEFNDIVDAKNALVNDGFIDKHRVGITGSSYGGYAAGWGATALTEHFAASVMFIGVSNLISKFGTTDIPNEMYHSHSLKWPWEQWQFLLERSPIYHAGKANTPLLILHGENDTRVHPSQSLSLYRYIKTQSKSPVRLVLYPNEGHGNRKKAAQLDYSTRLLRWMNHYLKDEIDRTKTMPPYALDTIHLMK